MRGGVFLFGESAALGDGGEVGAVDGEDGFEHVAGLGDVGVSVMTQIEFRSDPRVTATYRPRRVVASLASSTADGDGVGLVAVFGRRVAEPDMFADVVGGKGDVAVSADVGHGERPVAVGGGDGPQFPVADRFAGRW